MRVKEKEYTGFPRYYVRGYFPIFYECEHQNREYQVQVYYLSRGLGSTKFQCELSKSQKAKPRIARAACIAQMWEKESVRHSEAVVINHFFYWQHIFQKFIFGDTFQQQNMQIFKIKWQFYEFFLYKKYQNYLATYWWKKLETYSSVVTSWLRTTAPRIVGVLACVKWSTNERGRAGGV